MSKMKKSEQGPSRKRTRVTNPEREFVLRCYKEQNGQSWEDVLEHVRENLDSLPFSSPAVEFYMETDDQQAINRIRRIVSAEMKAATSTESKSSGPMSDIVSSKMRYAEKKNPEERYQMKFSQMQTSSSNPDSSSSEDGQDLECVKQSAKSKKPKTKRKGSIRKSKVEDAHVAMCKKAMKTLDKVNVLLDKYGDSSSSSD